jgi:hypothetical protein
MNVKEQLADPDLLLQDEEHFVCCHDETKTYCGAPTSEPMTGWADEVSCPACRAISILDEAMGGLFCPLSIPCTHALYQCSCPPEIDE